jgi:hypothetical protein
MSLMHFIQITKPVWHFQLVKLEYTSNFVSDQRCGILHNTVLSFEDKYYKSLQNSAMKNGFNCVTIFYWHAIKTIHILFFIDLTVILLLSGKYDPLTYLSWPFQKLWVFFITLLYLEKDQCIPFIYAYFRLGQYVSGWNKYYIQKCSMMASSSSAKLNTLIQNRSVFPVVNMFPKHSTNYLKHEFMHSLHAKIKVKLIPRCRVTMIH